jgi:hypothetical protein
MEGINWIRNFQVSDGEISHSSFLGRRDVFTRTGKIFVPLEFSWKFFDILAQCVLDKVKFYFSEIPTPVFPFIEDIDISGSDLQEFVISDFFLNERFAALRTFLPDIGNFCMHIPSGSCSGGCAFNSPTFHFQNWTSCRDRRFELGRTFPGNF